MTVRMGAWAKAEPVLKWCEPAALKCDCSDLEHHSSIQHVVSMNTGIGTAWHVYFYFFSWWIVKSAVMFRAAVMKLELFLTISSQYDWNNFLIENSRLLENDICLLLCYSFPFTETIPEYGWTTSKLYLEVNCKQFRCDWLFPPQGLILVLQLQYSAREHSCIWLQWYCILHVTKLSF